MAEGHEGAPPSGAEGAGAESWPLPVRPDELRSHFRDRLDSMVQLLSELARIESPTDVPSSHARVHEILVERWSRLGYRSRHVPGRRTSGHRLFVPVERDRTRPVQLMVGHLDTVWPLGTLGRMPVRAEGGLLRGPGRGRLSLRAV